MKQLSVLLSLAIAATILVGCGGKNKVTMPPELAPLAQEFKAMQPGAAKIELGKKLRTLLPTCTRPGANGQLATIDYDNPTYMLKLQDLYALLGQPSETTPDFVTYELGDKEAAKNEKIDGKGAGKKVATLYLLIDVYDDYVSSARIDAVSKK